ncbi:MAG: hypothetical protein ACYTG5_19680, partial [Planctomycetota bacterium]
MIQDPTGGAGGITVSSTEIVEGDPVRVVVAGEAKSIEVVIEGVPGVRVISVPPNGIVTVDTTGAAAGKNVVISDGKVNGDRVD